MGWTGSGLGTGCLATGLTGCARIGMGRAGVEESDFSKKISPFGYRESSHGGPLSAFLLPTINLTLRCFVCSVPLSSLSAASPENTNFRFRVHLSAVLSLREFRDLPFVVFCFNLPFPLPTRRFSKMSSRASQSVQSVHDFTVKDARGEDVDLSIYKGKVLLIVNVASQCGLTNSNYTEMSQLYEKYKDKGLEILAFPCNQFAGQEPGSNEEIVEFACTRFKAEYPIFDKVDVNGQNAAPIYKFLKSSKGGLFGDSIKWNFSKFLVDKEGRVVDRYAPTTSPLSIEKDIKKLLETS
ncbi:hypothetical protein IEQ34_015111 [Dendrobium chrysotoxum]|uniref:Glutathione peroxidase n=1 Tax=Dendrobium chrysotoxum TaxID=161865 RepID=A0AAV7GNZ7_DENCH|nr:hypothetical protein IEQ34_015111 [Dendrobium chrysotoxum]